MLMSNGAYGHGRGMGMELLNRWRVGCGVGYVEGEQEREQVGMMGRIAA